MYAGSLPIDGRRAGAATWAGVPIPALFLTMLVLRAVDPPGAYLAPRLLLVVQIALMLLTSAVVAGLVLRSFLASGAPELLLLGCGIMAWGLSGVVAGLVSRGDVNVSVTVHNLCVWLSAVCHV